MNDLYTRHNNPLFIPEIRSEPDNAAKVFYAIGHYNAIGFSPISIESYFDESLAKSYRILQHLSADILTHQTEGVLLDTTLKTQTVTLGNHTLTVSHEGTLGWSGIPVSRWREAGAILIRLNGDQTHQGRHIRIPSGEWGIQHVKLYHYK